MEKDKKLKIEVAYALPEKQQIVAVLVPPEATVEDAIKHSGILNMFPEIDLAVNKAGIFGKLTKMTATLRPGDRIEIYRKLIADPKEVRRQREAAGKKMKKGGGNKEKETPAKSSSDASASSTG